MTIPLIEEKNKRSNENDSNYHSRYVSFFQIMRIDNFKELSCLIKKRF